jgi:hypothetical protein
LAILAVCLATQRPGATGVVQRPLARQADHLSLQRKGLIYPRRGTTRHVDGAGIRCAERHSDHPDQRHAVQHRGGISPHASARVSVIRRPYGRNATKMWASIDELVCR